LIPAKTGPAIARIRENAPHLIRKPWMRHPRKPQVHEHTLPFMGGIESVGNR
jgi:hypothetical protein